MNHIGMREIKEQLRQVTERIDALKEHPSTLTKDAVLNDLRKLYDAVADADVAQGEAEVEASGPSTVIPTVEKEPEPVPAEQKVEEEITVKEEIPPQEKSVVNEVSETASDKNILAGKLNRTPLGDLRSGIPLNEKFGIIQNLFKGNASDFGDAVLKLNNSDSPKEMGHYLNLLKQRLGWDEENESYIAFAGYVERRMMSSETSSADSDR